MNTPASKDSIAAAEGDRRAASAAVRPLLNHIFSCAKGKAKIRLRQEVRDLVSNGRPPEEIVAAAQRILSEIEKEQTRLRRSLTRLGLLALLAICFSLYIQVIVRSSDEAASMSVFENKRAEAIALGSSLTEPQACLVATLQRQDMHCDITSGCDEALEFASYCLRAAFEHNRSAALRQFCAASLPSISATRQVRALRLLAEYSYCPADALPDRGAAQPSRH